MFMSVWEAMKGDVYQLHAFCRDQVDSLVIR